MNFTARVKIIQGDQDTKGWSFQSESESHSLSLCRWLCDTMDYTIHGTLQAKIQKWIAFPFSRGSYKPRDRTQVSLIAGRFFTSWAAGEVFKCIINYKPGQITLACKFQFVSVCLIWSTFSSVKWGDSSFSRTRSGRFKAELNGVEINCFSFSHSCKAFDTASYLQSVIPKHSWHWAPTTCQVPCRRYRNKKIRSPCTYISWTITQQ